MKQNKRKTYALHNLADKFTFFPFFSRRLRIVYVSLQLYYYPKKYARTADSSAHGRQSVRLMGTKAWMTDRANATSLSEVDLPPRRKEKLKPGRTLIVLPEAGSSREFPPAVDGIVCHCNWPFNAISPLGAKKTCKANRETTTT